MKQSTFANFSLALSLSICAFGFVACQQDKNDPSLTSDSNPAPASTVLKSIDYIDWTDVRLGCEARALYGAMESAAQKLKDYSLYIFPEPGQKISNDIVGTEWDYHVAPIFSENGGLRMLDKAFSEEVLTIPKWIKKVDSDWIEGKKYRMLLAPGSFFTRSETYENSDADYEVHYNLYSEDWRNHPPGTAVFESADQLTKAVPELPLKDLRRPKFSPWDIMGSCGALSSSISKAKKSPAPLIERTKELLVKLRNQGLLGHGEPKVLYGEIDACHLIDGLTPSEIQPMCAFLTKIKTALPTTDFKDFPFQKYCR